MLRPSPILERAVSTTGTPLCSCFIIFRFCILNKSYVITDVVIASWCYSVWFWRIRIKSKKKMGNYWVISLFIIVRALSRKKHFFSVSKTNNDANLKNLYMWIVPQLFSDSEEESFRSAVVTFFIVMERRFKIQIPHPGLLPTFFAFTRWWKPPVSPLPCSRHQCISLWNKSDMFLAHTFIFWIAIIVCFFLIDHCELLSNRKFESLIFIFISRIGETCNTALPVVFNHAVANSPFLSKCFCQLADNEYFQGIKQQQ